MCAYEGIHSRTAPIGSVAQSIKQQTGNLKAVDQTPIRVTRFFNSWLDVMSAETKMNYFLKKIRKICLLLSDLEIGGSQVS